MERYSGVACAWPWAVSEAQRSQAISDGAWDGGGHSSRDGGGMGIAGQRPSKRATATAAMAAMVVRER